ncbi:hypothetical protein SAMN04488005_1523 [Yoonia tamlensis]|uniref:Uncharacterized protein n=1 Tax=Yoonia tamlensis TaxID=390270 RepID=A0A1I6GEF7_9RHOB|nr:hypothetical protein [Yoonia tamlensis]SFR40585.1 hypothetical protein SAMN04488005_1523 [Yoonia tamlensis]
MTQPASDRKGQPIVIRGVTYLSQAQAARALGVKPAAVCSAQARGRLNSVGLRRAQSVPEPNEVAPLVAVKPPPVQRRPIHRDLASVFHPRWCSRDDRALLTAKSAGDGIAAIADRLGRPCIAIEQRWHRLRAVPDIVKRLEAYGLSNEPYPELEAGARFAKPVSGIRTRAQSIDDVVSGSDGGIDHEH